MTGSCTVPQIFLGGVHVGGRDELMKRTNNFDSASIRRWYESPSTVSASEEDQLNTRYKIVPSVALESDDSGTEHGHPGSSQDSLVEDLAMKAFVLRTHFGMGNCTIETDRILERVREEQWGTDEELAKLQVLQMANAGVFEFEGTQGDHSPPSKLPAVCIFPTLDCVNKIVDCEALQIEVRSADDIIPKLRLTTSMLYDKLLFAEGKGVNFENVTLYPQLWKTFLGLFVQLQQVSNLEEKPDCYRKAFFINLYNILHFASCVMLGNPTSSYERLKFFSLSVQLGSGFLFTLDDIEHGVLRAVRFSSNDIREKLVVPFDPRIHFTLNCGAKSW